MLDRAEQRIWFEEYFRAGLRVMPKPVHIETRREIAAWARSMSLIAEQFVDNNDDGPVEATP